MRIYSTGTGGPRGKGVTEEGGREVSLHWNFVFDVDRECNRRFHDRVIVVRQSALTLSDSTHARLLKYPSISMFKMLRDVTSTNHDGLDSSHSIS